MSPILDNDSKLCKHTNSANVPGKRLKTLLHSLEKMYSIENNSKLYCVWEPLPMLSLEKPAWVSISSQCILQKFSKFVGGKHSCTMSAGIEMDDSQDIARLGLYTPECDWPCLVWDLRWPCHRHYTFPLSRARAFCKAHLWNRRKAPTSSLKPIP